MGSSHSKQVTWLPSKQGRLPPKTEDQVYYDQMLSGLDHEHKRRLREFQAQAQGQSFIMDKRRAEAVDLDIFPEAYAPPPTYTSSSLPPSLSSSTSLNPSITSNWTKTLLSSPKNRLAISALSQNSAQSIIASPNALIADTQTFNTRIPHEGAPVTNQRASGRCWLFAATNVFRIALMKKYNIKEFELSQAYLFFWDKLEKANYFLENVIETADEPLDGRLLSTLLSSPVSDGGQWDMLANLVNKYGVIPQQLYPDNYHAQNSATLSSLMTTKLREDALRLRALASDPSTRANPSVLSSAKTAYLHELHTILSLLLGPPPAPDKEFTWSYYDASGKFHSLTTTPIAFSSSLSSPSSLRALGGTDPHRLFSLVHDPRNAYYTLLTVDRLGNIAPPAGRPVTYVNVPIATLKTAALRMLQKGWPVFFGSDVGKFSDSARGVMDTRLYDYNVAFNVELGMGKAARLRTGESAMTHAMVLTGCQVEKGEDGKEKTVRWRVENSWSESAGDKGYFVMTDEWMDEFVYQVVVDPGVVGKQVTDVLEQKPTRLELWDPMGALA